MSRWARDLTADEIRQIFDILVAECDVRPDQFAMFEASWPKCVEYRFMGSLGGGGKIWWNPSSQHAPVYVTCYPEDESNRRHDIVERVNEKLASFGVVPR